MSTIEQALSEKTRHDSMEQSLYKCLNIDKYYDPNRDKHGVSFDRKTWHSPGEEFYLVAYEGYYGSSNCSYRMDKTTAEYIVKVINKMMPDIVEKALEYSKEDADRVMLAAEQEAKRILELVSETKAATPFGVEE